MDEHPIEGLMLTAMNSIRDMIDVNTIIGEPIETANDIIIIPISKVGFGFAVGGSEFNGETLDEYLRKDKEEEVQYKLPFGGGSGAGVSITPVAFLIVQGENAKILRVSNNSAIDRLLDYVPDLLEKVNNMFNSKIEKQKENDNENGKENLKNEEDDMEIDGDIEEKFETISMPKIHPKRNKNIKYEYKNRNNEEYNDDEYNNNEN